MLQVRFVWCFLCLCLYPSLVSSNNEERRKRVFSRYKQWHVIIIREGAEHHENKGGAYIWHTLNMRTREVAFLTRFPLCSFEQGKFFSSILLCASRQRGSFLRYWMIWWWCCRLLLFSNDVGDIYIMMKCLSVCLFVTKNEHFLVGFHGFQDSFRVFHGFSR